MKTNHTNVSRLMYLMIIWL